MDLLELEETLQDMDIFPSGFSLETNRRGEVIIHTHLRADDDGDLVPMDDDGDDDMDFDPNFEPLEEEEDGDVD